MRPFGRQTLTFVTVTEDLTNPDRYNNPAEVRTSIDVRGCHFRPLTTAEKIDLGDVVSDTWRATVPPVAAVLAAKADDEVVAGGITYEIVGSPEPFTNLVGELFKVTVVCKRVSA
ncbi:hypothetical protein QN239_26785 [Mycolicibacterium sp. Y3]